MCSIGLWPAQFGVASILKCESDVGKLTAGNSEEGNSEYSSMCSAYEADAAEAARAARKEVEGGDPPPCAAINDAFKRYIDMGNSHVSSVRADAIAASQPEWRGVSEGGRGGEGCRGRGGGRRGEAG